MLRRLNAPLSEEAERINREYARRERELPSDLYVLRRPENFYFHSETARACIELLNDAGCFPLTHKRILDVGCGAGMWPLEFVQWGASPALLAGVDLDQSRLEVASSRLPEADFVQSDAASLPWPDAHFDLVSQFTVFSSILDPEVRGLVAREMFRVVRPGGLILWFDFLVNNPCNPAVRGVPAGEVNTLFPTCQASGRKVLLAPPLARRIAPLSWLMLQFFGSLTILRTHYAAALRRPL